MGFNWIDTREFSFNSILLMDRWIISGILTDQNEEFRANMGIALAHNPAVAWYCKLKAPEVAAVVDKMIALAPPAATPEEIRAAECFVLAQHDWAVVYVYPEVMEQHCPYIYGWDSERLYELADFTGKTVLDVGAGTGRLTFAAAKKAKHVYASEPVDRLREYMREKIRRESIQNVTVLDGMCDCLPYEDSTFDIVMSGHVVGDDYERETAELTRVVKLGGVLLDCPGEDDRKCASDRELVNRGWEQFHYVSQFGGDVYLHRKLVLEKNGSPADRTVRKEG